MSNKFDPNLNMFYGWPLGTNGWNEGMDNNLKKVGALLFLSVISRSETTAPAIINGARYLIPTGATGAWSGKTNQIAVAIEDAWEFYTPKNGWDLVIEDEDNKSLTYSQAESAWEDSFVDVSGLASKTEENTWTQAQTFNQPLKIQPAQQDSEAASLAQVKDAVEGITYESLGAGADVFAGIDSQSGAIGFKSIRAGGNVSISENGEEITISASGGGSGTTETVTLKEWTPTFTTSLISMIPPVADFGSNSGAAISPDGSTLSTVSAGAGVNVIDLQGLEQSTQRNGSYYKFIRPTTMQDGEDFFSLLGFISGDSSFSDPQSPSPPSFSLGMSIRHFKDAGIEKTEIQKLGNLIADSDVTTFNQEITVTPNTEYCIAFDKDEGQYGTVYFYTSENPNVPFTRALTAPILTFQMS